MENMFLDFICFVNDHRFWIMPAVLVCVFIATLRMFLSEIRGDHADI